MQARAVDQTHRPTSLSGSRKAVLTGLATGTAAMSGIARTNSSGRRRSARTSGLPTRECRRGIANRLKCLISTIELAFEVRRERRLLLGMHERVLKDLGLIGIAEAEARRPFWDLPLERLRPEAGCRCGFGAGE